MPKKIEKKKKKPAKPATVADSRARSKKASDRKTIERVLSVGAAAKIKLYHGYLGRISRGEALRPGEVKNFRQLESELEAAAGLNGNGGGVKGNVFASMDAAAEYVGTSKKTISLHIKKGKLRQNADGTFAREDLDRWLEKYGRRAGETSADIESIKEQQEKAELRFRIARARKEEILASQLEKTVAPWEDIEKEWSERVRLVTAGLEAFADRLPPLLVGRSREEIYRILKTEARELCERYSRDGRYCPKLNG